MSQCSPFFVSSFIVFGSGEAQPWAQMSSGVDEEENKCPRAHVKSKLQQLQAEGEDTPLNDMRGTHT